MKTNFAETGPAGSSSESLPAPWVALASKPAGRPAWWDAEWFVTWLRLAGK
jgi:hypothetical protein